MKKQFLVLASISGVLAVCLGAFGAHGLEDSLTLEELNTFQTGSEYQFYHTIALAIVALCAGFLSPKLIKWSGWCFVIGIVLFSGSLYLLSTHTLTGIPTKILGPITPIGGTFFIAGWAMLAVAALRSE